MKKIYILLLLIQCLLVACNEKQLEEKQVDCYFQYEYVNYAWGFSHSGFTISPSGEVFSFDKSTQWVFADKDRLSLTSLKKNIEASVKVDTLINKSEIEYYGKLALSAISGELSTPIMRGADMGAIICKIIVPDDGNPLGGYREVILTKNGDFDQYNLSPEAALIAEWLYKFRFH